MPFLFELMFEQLEVDFLEKMHCHKYTIWINITENLLN